MTDSRRSLTVLREHGSAVDAECHINTDLIECEIDGSHYSAMIQPSLPRALEHVRQELELAYKDSVHFRHCIHCVQFRYSSMAFQMARGWVGRCDLHKMDVDPLFYCTDF